LICRFTLRLPRRALDSSNHPLIGPAAADMRAHVLDDFASGGFTLLAGPSDPRWSRFAASIPSRASVDVHRVDAATADALDLPPTGALVMRPDGREVRRWIDADTATTEGFDWARLGSSPELEPGTGAITNPLAGVLGTGARHLEARVPAV
jgi:hypothetical protein